MGEGEKGRVGERTSQMRGRMERRGVRFGVEAAGWSGSKWMKEKEDESTVGVGDDGRVIVWACGTNSAAPSTASGRSAGMTNGEPRTVVSSEKPGCELCRRWRDCIFMPKPHNSQAIHTTSVTCPASARTLQSGFRARAAILRSVHSPHEAAI